MSLHRMRTQRSGVRATFRDRLRTSKAGDDCPDVLGRALVGVHRAMVVCSRGVSTTSVWAATGAIAPQSPSPRTLSVACLADRTRDLRHSPKCPLSARHEIEPASAPDRCGSSQMRSACRGGNGGGAAALATAPLRRGLGPVPVVAGAHRGGGAPLARSRSGEGRYRPGIPFLSSHRGARSRPVGNSFARGAPHRCGHRHACQAGRPVTSIRHLDATYGSFASIRDEQRGQAARSAAPRATCA